MDNKSNLIFMNCFFDSIILFFEAHILFSPYFWHIFNQVINAIYEIHLQKTFVFYPPKDQSGIQYYISLHENYIDMYTQQERNDKSQKEKPMNQYVADFEAMPLFSGRRQKSVALAALKPALFPLLGMLLMQRCVPHGCPPSPNWQPQKWLFTALRLSKISPQMGLFTPTDQEESLL